MKWKKSKVTPTKVEKLPDDVLKDSMGLYEEVLVIGWDKKEREIRVLSSDSLTHSKVLWLIEEFKVKLLNGDYSEI